MQYLQIVNWDSFQHYRDRNPPWIKLHNQILENYEFTQLPDTAKGHLFGLWLLASRTGNKIPLDHKWIANKLNATVKVDIDRLFKSGFLMLHPDSDVLAERSTIGTRLVPLGEERREEKSRVEKRRGGVPPTLEEVQIYIVERNSPIDANHFFDYQQTRDWKLKSGQKIKDWKACIRTWEKNNINKPPVSMIEKVSSRDWAE